MDLQEKYSGEETKLQNWWTCQYLASEKLFYLTEHDSISHDGVLFEGFYDTEDKMAKEIKILGIKTNGFGKMNPISVKEEINMDIMNLVKEINKLK